jgi:rubrerythrin
VTRDTLEELARMEDQHEKTFAGLRAGLTAEEKKPGAFDPEDETALYLKALADRRVFHQKTIDMTSLEQVLKAAMAAEKDSIAFYVGMRELVPGDLGKAKVRAIIKEEMSHMVILAGKLKQLG